MNEIDNRTGEERALEIIGKLKDLESMRYGAERSREEIADTAEDAIVTIRLLLQELRAARGDIDASKPLKARIT